eukprot:TRINITY_DN10416_c0_g2_i1.p1 TRINITY_DN10416_c0_g2~~TRINITY_DN10416_c0_g2_i1.p1  ORF type:complete len:647 (-),score=128.85 TRINITY_DN10416_c0_g2_i1:27-1967(-)
MLRIIVIAIALAVAVAASQNVTQAPSTPERCAQAFKELEDKFKQGQTADLLAVILNSGHGAKELGQFEACNRNPKDKYAVMTIAVPGAVTQIILYYGICGPAECDASDYTQFMESHRTTIENTVSSLTGASLHGLIFDTYFPSQVGHKIDFGTVFSIGIVVIILGLSVAGFLYTEVFNTPNKRRIQEEKANLEAALVVPESAEAKKKSPFSILKLFDPVENFKKFAADGGRGDPNLRFFNGLRFFMIYWVIFGHQYMFSMLLSSNIQDYADLFKDPFTLMVYAAEFSVDVFFVMSGFFFVFIFQRRYAKKSFGVVDYGLTLLHRILRLVPSYGVVILLVYRIMQFFGKGPLWQVYIQTQDSNCSENAWADILFVNNIALGNKLKSDCIGWGWYLGCDMQIFLIMPFVTLALLRKKSLGKLFTWAIIAVSLIYSYYLVLAKGYKELAVGNHKPDYIANYYVVPWTRVSTYLFGALLGFWYTEEKGAISKWIASSRVAQVICSTIGALTMYAMIVVVAPLQTDKNAFNDTQYALYTAGSRIVFVAGLAAFFLPALLGAKLPNVILGNRFFELTAKLNFATYLIHLVMIQFIGSNSYTATFLSHPAMVYASIRSAAFAFFAALLLHVFVELPFANLEQVFFRHGKKAHK